jgi:hypothetical protein
MNASRKALSLNLVSSAFLMTLNCPVFAKDTVGNTTVHATARGAVFI